MSISKIWASLGRYHPWTLSITVDDLLGSIVTGPEIYERKVSSQYLVSWTMYPSPRHLTSHRPATRHSTLVCPSPLRTSWIHDLKDAWRRCQRLRSGNEVMTKGRLHITCPKYTLERLGRQLRWWAKVRIGWLMKAQVWIRSPPDYALLDVNDWIECLMYRSWPTSCAVCPEPRRLGSHRSTNATIYMPNDPQNIWIYNLWMLVCCKSRAGVER